MGIIHVVDLKKGIKNEDSFVEKNGEKKLGGKGGDVENKESITSLCMKY